MSYFNRNTVPITGPKYCTDAIPLKVVLILLNFNMINYKSCFHYNYETNLEKKTCENLLRVSCNKFITNV